VAAEQAPPPAAPATAPAVVQEPQLAVCKFWVNTGRCAKGDACPYAHLADCRKAWVTRRYETVCGGRPQAVHITVAASMFPCQSVLLGRAV
jgi:hypothetical protein